MAPPVAAAQVKGGRARTHAGRCTRPHFCWRGRAPPAAPPFPLAGARSGSREALTSALARERRRDAPRDRRRSRPRRRQSAGWLSWHTAAARAAQWTPAGSKRCGSKWNSGEAPRARAFAGRALSCVGGRAGASTSAPWSGGGPRRATCSRTPRSWAARRPPG